MTRPPSPSTRDPGKAGEERWVISGSRNPTSTLCGVFWPQAARPCWSDERPRLDDADAVREALDLVEVVGGQEHSPSLGNYSQGASS